MWFFTQIVKITSTEAFRSVQAIKRTPYKVSLKLYTLKLSNNGQYSSSSVVVSWRGKSNYKDSNV